MYGGTKTEMQRLLKDAQAIQRAQGKNVKYSINNLSDVYEAIHVIQESMGVTGTTAEEAAKTISGSFLAFKASWSNLLSGLGTDQEMDELVDNLLDSGENLIRNVMELVPRIGKRAIKAIDSFLMRFDFYQTLKHAFDQGGWDGVASAAIGMIKTAFTTFWDEDLPTLATNAVNGVISGINNLFGTNIPAITSIKLPKWSEIKNVVTQWWNGLKSSISSVCDWVLGIFDSPVETADQTKAAVKDWWTGTAQPAIESACTWILQVFENPTEDQAAVTKKISEWWASVSGGIASVVTFVARLVGVEDGTAEGIETATATWFKSVGEGLSKVCKFVATLGTPDEEDTEKAKQELYKWFKESFLPGTAEVLKVGVKVGFELAEDTTAALVNLIENAIQKALENLGLGWLFQDTEQRVEYRENLEAQSGSDPRQYAGFFSWLNEGAAEVLQDYADMAIRAGGQNELGAKGSPEHYEEFMNLGGTQEAWDQFRTILSSVTDALMEGADEEGRMTNEMYGVLESWFEGESGAVEDAVTSAAEAAAAAQEAANAAQEAANAASTVAASIGSITVEMDGQTVGELVTPTVAAGLARLTRVAGLTPTRVGGLTP